MDKITKITRIIDRITHDFYCDECGIHLGTITEYDDGYYEELGEFELQFYMKRGWYKLHKCLCDECKEEYLDKICVALEDMGFVKEN